MSRQFSEKTEDLFRAWKLDKWKKIRQDAGKMESFPKRKACQGLRRHRKCKL
ncbi:hypothetical protein [Methanosarcina sp. A14]|uniref:hypothetical protein n=1 Tax=Methanosarcina sp. A14 TaxID=1860098 RepID=UPI002101C078|nr:hypothetical protein [Methanosarcina sp. A14]